MLNIVEFRAMALVMSSRATSSWTMACRAGASKALATPNPKARTMMCQGRMTVEKGQPAVMKARTIIADWVMIMRWRRDIRSATTPA